jgi:hypothetical protein
VKEANRVDIVSFGKPLCAALFLLNALTAGGYSGQLERSDVPEFSPSDVKLTIRTRGGESVFRIGETIELDLLFTSAARKKYLVYDSNEAQPFPTERIAVEPLSAWDNPLVDIDQLCPTIIIQSVLSSTNFLSAKPFVVGLELNRWIRFKDPGEYKISVQSQRAFRRNPKRLLTLRSNRLSLTIVPAETHWQEQTLNSAVAVLDKTGSAADLTWEQRQPRWHATSVVRNLGTPAAAGEMAHRLQSEDLAYYFLFGLIESPARESALEQMQGLLRDADFPVSNRFLCAMAVVALGPDRTAQTTDQKKALQARFRDELRAALKDKRGKALVESTKTAESVQ